MSGCVRVTPAGNIRVKGNGRLVVRPKPGASLGAAPAALGLDGTDLYRYDAWVLRDAGQHIGTAVAPWVDVSSQEGLESQSQITPAPGRRGTFAYEGERPAVESPRYQYYLGPQHSDHRLCVALAFTLHGRDSFGTNQRAVILGDNRNQLLLARYHGAGGETWDLRFGAANRQLVTAVDALDTLKVMVFQYQSNVDLHWVTDETGHVVQTLPAVDANQTMDSFTPGIALAVGGQSGGNEDLPCNVALHEMRFYYGAYLADADLQAVYDEMRTKWGGL